MRNADGKESIALKQTITKPANIILSPGGSGNTATNPCYFRGLRGNTANVSVLRSVGAQSIRVYATVDNLATLFSPYKRQTGIDPTGTNLGSSGVTSPGNLRSNTNGNGVVTISATTPATRTFTVGLNVSF